MDNPNELSVALTGKLDKRIDWTFFKEFSLSLDRQKRQLAVVAGSFSLSWCAIQLEHTSDISETFKPNDIDMGFHEVW